MSIFALLVTVLFILFVVSAAYVFVVWIRRRRFTKERFAFASLSAIVFLTGIIASSITRSSMPWHAIERVIYWISGQSFTVPEPKLVDFLFLLGVYSLSIFAIVNLFKNWDGLRSVAQYSAEQRKQEMSLLTEGARELRRIILRLDPPSIYEPEPYSLSLDLAVATDDLPWRHRALELVQLRWSHYAFSKDDGWLHTEQCWVGRNVEANNPVLLRCASHSIASSELRSLIKRAEQIKSDQLASQIELIVAIEDGLPSPIGSMQDTAVRFETESTLLDDLIDWTEYRNDVRKRMSVVKLPDSALTVLDVFVEPHFTPVYEDPVSDHPLQAFLDCWLNEPGQRHVALLGDYGQGKSTSALAFAYRELNLRRAHRVPILIELRGKSPRNTTPLELLAGWSAKYNINPRSLMYLNRSGRLVLIFEGFDEMALAGDAEMRLKHFKTLWAFCHPSSKILITGRPNFFFDEEELLMSLGIGSPTPDKPYCTAIRLKPFSVEQVAGALRKHNTRVREEICRFAVHNEQFRELISRPSLLHVVAILWSKDHLLSKLKDLTSAYIMDRFIRHSFNRQGLKEQDSPEFMALTTEERQYFMKGIAAYMASQDLQNQIGGAQLNETVAALVDSIPEIVSRRSPAITGEVRQPLRDRIAGIEHGLEHVQTDVRTCGILVDDPAAPGTFKFGHKSFMEYLIAEIVAGDVLDNKVPDSPSIWAACKASARDISKLPVSIGFLSELLGTGIHGSVEDLSDQRRLARRMLILLAGGGVTVRYILFRHALIASSRALPGVFRPFTWIIDPMLAPAVVYTIWLFHRIELSQAGIIAVVAGSVLQLIAASVVGMWWANKRPITRMTSTLGAISVWSKLCLELGFKDRVLFQIAGIGWLFWTRGQPFDFFLRSSGKMGGSDNGSSN